MTMKMKSSDELADHSAAYEELSQALFKEWEQRIKREISFGADGAVDPVLYFASRPRVLYILKEIHGSPWTTDDLRLFLRNKANRGFTWNNVVRWKRLMDSAFLAPGAALPDYDEQPPIGTRERKRELASIAAINLKKVPGTSDAHDNTIQLFAKQHGDLLARQVALIDPDIIIAGGVLLKHIHGFEGLDEKKEPFWCVEDLLGRKRLVVWSYHPQAYGKDRVSYNFMRKVADEASQRHGQFWQ